MAQIDEIRTFSRFPRIPENHYFVDIKINTSGQNDFFAHFFSKSDFFLSFFGKSIINTKLSWCLKKYFLKNVYFREVVMIIFLKKTHEIWWLKSL